MCEVCGAHRHLESRAPVDFYKAQHNWINSEFLFKISEKNLNFKPYYLTSLVTLKPNAIFLTGTINLLTQVC